MFAAMLVSVNEMLVFMGEFNFPPVLFPTTSFFLPPKMNIFTLTALCETVEEGSLV